MMTSHASVVFFICELLYISATNISYLVFFSKLHKSKYNNKPKRYFAFFLNFTAVSALGVAISYLNNGFLNLIASYLLINLTCLVLFECKLGQCLLHNALFAVMGVMCEFLSASTIYVMSNFSKYDFAELVENEQVKAIMCLIAIIFVYLVYRLAVTMFIKKANSSSFACFAENSCLILLILFELFIVSQYAAKADCIDDGMNIIIMICGFIGLNIAAVHAVKKIAGSYELEKDYAVLQQQNKLQYDMYTEVEYSRQCMDSLAHDMKNHLQMMCDIWLADPDKAKQYRKKIENALSHMFLEFNCENKLLCIIISHKYSTAKREGYIFEISFQDISFDFIEDIDLTAIFANLLDNAIEACRRIAYDTERKISVRVRKQNDFVKIIIENSSLPPLLNKNGEILSSKAKHRGIGMRSARQAVEKYKGTIEVSYNAGKFTACIMFSESIAKGVYKELNSNSGAI